MKCLVSGGLGFIGSHLVDLLLEQGHEVVIFDNALTGKVENVEQHITEPGNPNCSLVMGSVANRSEVEQLFSDYQFDYVFHLAADARIPSCTDDPIGTTEVNLMGTLNLLEASKKQGVKGFVFSSSSSVYGNVSTGAGGAEQEIPENTRMQPISIYGMQKAAAENMVRAYKKYYGLNTIALRYFNVYGSARQNEAGAYPCIFAALAKAEKNKEVFHIFGNGEMCRDYVHVHDVARANSLVIGKPETWKAWGNVYNIGTGIPTSVKELISIYGYKNFDFVPPRAEDVRWSLASTWRAKDEYGFVAKIDIQEGVSILRRSHGFDR